MPERKEVKIVDLLREKRRESVNLLLTKINMKVDDKLREEMQKEEEEWENLKKGVVVAGESSSESDSSSDTDKNEDYTYTSGKKSSVEGSDRKRGDFITKQFSEDAEEEKQDVRTKKKKIKKKKHKKSKD